MRSEREHHTRVGWWLMTHERATAVLIGSIGCVVLGADLLYTASEWSKRFGRGFLLGFVVLITTATIAKLLGFGRPIGRDRRRASRLARRDTIVFVVLIGILVVASDAIGEQTAALLGSVAALASISALACLYWLIR